MSLSRRDLLLSSAALAAFSAAQPAKSWFPHGQQQIGHGWNVLPLGCGGLSIGLDIAADGTVVCRTDVGNAYIFSGTTAQVSDPSKTWLALMNYTSLGSGYVQPSGDYNGCWELVIAPTQTTNLYAIFPNSGGASFTWALYYSTNSGQTWTKSAVTMTITNGSNGTWKTSTRKIVVDPANASVVYCGIATGNSGIAGLYVAIDGATFNPATTNGTTQFPASSGGSGTCGLCFDVNGGTQLVGGQTRTKRLLVPLGGTDIYETTDGGQNFTSSGFASAAGRSDISVHQAYMDYDGVYYCIVSYAGSNTNLHVWRYAPASARGPATGTGWIEITAQSGWTHGSSWIGQSGENGAGLIVDPRNGHQGYLTMFGPNGIGVGYTSTNANSATGSSIAWGGSSGGQVTNLTAPSYDCSWLNHVGTSSFTDGSACVIDQNGTCWWVGNQGALWKFTASDLSTPTIPNYAVSTTTYSVSTSRGTEVTVAQDSIEAPGAPYPCIAAQDVGIFQTSFQPGFYPSNFWPSPSRVDCENLEYAASDPSFYVGKINTEVGVAPITGGMFSSYSPNYGVQGTWAQFSVMPDLLWFATATCTIDNGAGVSGNILTVSSISSVTGQGGVILPGATVYKSGASNPSYGQVQAYGTGGTTGTGGVGTYSLSQSTLLPSQSFVIGPVTAGGQMVAVDHTHIVCCITHNSGSFVPGYTDDGGATGWKFCGGLPARDWMNRGYNFGTTSRPFAVGYGSDLGTVWAFEMLSGTGTLWRSTDSGANFTSVATMAVSVSVGGGPYLLSVPGFPDELWLSATWTGGTSNVYRITNARTGVTPTITAMGTPPSDGICHTLTLGLGPSPGAYPAIYGVFNHSNGLGGTTVQNLYQGTFNGSTLSWSLFAHPTGTSQDMPPVSQVAGFQSVRGSWNQYQRIMVATGQCGFAYYNP